MSRLVESQTINIHGGTGGNGGRGGVRGGGGGTGEGPTLSYDIRAESFTLTNNLVGVQEPKSDFSFVRFGDVNLLDEIDKCTVIECHRIGRRQTVKAVVTRRIYRAQISGCQGPMTVVAYDNSKSEQIRAKVQEARRHRHPFLAQLFGFTCSVGVNALIYHDEMMTISQIETMHPQSALASFYIKHEMGRHIEAAQLYWEETTGKDANNLPGTIWIRLSTGKLCLDIGDGVEFVWSIRAGLKYTPAGLPSFKLTENELHIKLLHVLKPNEFHAMFAHPWRQNIKYNLSSSIESLSFPSIWIPSERVAFKSPQTLMIPFPNHLITSNDIRLWSWTCSRFYVEVMPTGWTRFEYQHSHKGSDWLSMSVRMHRDKENNVIKWWLSQRNYVHKHLQNVLAANVPLHLITGIHFRCILDPQLDSFTFQGTFMTDAPSKKVYLFLFPPQVEILDGQLTFTNPPDAEKYYWAFDPAGLDQLTHKAAEDIGLPTPEFSIQLSGPVLGEFTDAAICEFHSAKGFNPGSQDAAIKMGYPLVDVKDINKIARELTGECSMDCQDEEVDDGIYYSLALC
ncbi:hypothetical protein DFH08DRAFT_939242 [Mycena albidolilacea]|uniref:Uncharacterized protein n=1 Tax=Mycena albidolilacea TaxID=1033008 RepID=A0AAD6ZSR3_9AGAR|nr:hypothetical protein DFH08DRAFT_939242 [Mycena albidolilacea]